MFRRILLSCILALLPLAPGPAASSAAIPDEADAALRAILDRECLKLDKEKLHGLIAAELAADLAQGATPELLAVVEGVVKRTDFDGIAEEKTAEIIGLVYHAFRKGAPLEFLDDIFDVAYVNTISVDQLAAAALALQEFRGSDVPQDIYEEFVYRSIEDRWDPAQVPVYTRGLIYGVERGLAPDKVALIIMLDVRNGEAGRKTPEQVVLDAIKLVREKEPQRWKPLTARERETEAVKDRARTLERQKAELDSSLEQKERAMIQAQARQRELREYPSGREGDVDVEKLNRDIEALIRKLQGEIQQYQKKRQDVVVVLQAARSDVDRQQAVRDQERRARRDRELAQAQAHVATRAKTGRLDGDKLKASVDKYLGTPYRFGGDSEQGIDCSAFTRRVYRGQGVELPRNSREQARVSASVAAGSVRTGDLVFFDTSINGGISHVGVFLGDNVFAHASSSRGVTKSSLRERYYVKRFVKGGRIFND